MADDPLYERIETELKGVIEIYDHTPVDGHLTEGVMLRLSVNSKTDRRRAEIYLDPTSQQRLALALLANSKDPRL